MSIKIITEDGRSRLSFACDKCGKPIEPSEGAILWDSEPEKSLEDGSRDGTIACNHCKPSFKKAFTQPLEQGLIFLLAKAGWLDAAFKPSNKMEEAAKAAYKLAQF
jgi:DNA-directed RNA polymerase subunit RPC12/RpoP